uniref:Ovule protein n=1 Tax=Heterorhabditis bacteriophora TaxID=37862 RepID=A0A1I7WQN0_HETBA
MMNCTDYQEVPEHHLVSNLQRSPSVILIITYIDCCFFVINTYFNKVFEVLYNYLITGKFKLLHTILFFNF